MGSGSSNRLALPTLLSQALIAFTIELDNEWERRMPHRTSRFGGARGPWGVSLRQWSNFMQWVPPEGISVRELTLAARAAPQLNGMRRWGYVEIDGQTIRPRRGGLRAQEVWRTLPEEIEGRWSVRLGGELVSGLRAALEPVVAEREAGLPDWLTGTYGGFAAKPVAGATPDPARARPLSALLSIPLHSFSLSFERESAVSLMFTANVLRPLGEGEAGGLRPLGERETGVPVAELPRVSGVAAEALAPALGILGKGGFLEVGAGRGKVAALTDKGRAELDAYLPLCREIERGWELDRRVRDSLEAVLAQQSQLWPRIDPPPESWRSHLPPPEVLPHHPMPRQGGHPDGV